MRRTRKFQRTFSEDDEISIPVNWIDNIIWAYTYNYEPRDPAEFETRLSNKVKITIEIFNTNEDDTQGKIIEILNKYQSTIPPLHNEGMIDPMDFHKIADAILSLPLDVPREEEINMESQMYLPRNYESTLTEAIIIAFRGGHNVGAKWAINEILRRNKTE